MRAISQGNADLVQVRRSHLPPRPPSVSCPRAALRQPGPKLKLLCRFLPANHSCRVDGPGGHRCAAAAGAASCRAMRRHVRSITRSQGGASVAAAVEVSDSMVFLRCSVCANVLPASDDLSENRFCSRCRAVTHMPKIDAAAWDYAGVTPLHAALTREAPAEVALQASASRRVLLPARLTRGRSCCGTAPTQTPRLNAARLRCTSRSPAAGKTCAKSCWPTAATQTPPPPSRGRRRCTGAARPHSPPPLPLPPLHVI